MNKRQYKLLCSYVRGQETGQVDELADHNYQSFIEQREEWHNLTRDEQRFIERQIRNTWGWTQPGNGKDNEGFIESLKKQIGEQVYLKRELQSRILDRIFKKTEKTRLSLAPPTAEIVIPQYEDDEEGEDEEI